MKTIGFFGGSFDPIHFGHINLALQLKEVHSLDEVIFCPAFCSPFKTASPPIAAPEHRVEMLKVAIEAIDGFKISTIEVDRKGPSYTIDTIRALKSDEVNFRLMLSEEAALRFDLWKEPEELIRLAPPLIGVRGYGNVVSGPFEGAFRKGITPTKIMEISSTEIRERLKKGLYCGHLIPAKALDYIHAYRLYK